MPLMQIVEYLALACFVAGVVVASFGLASTGLYLFAVGVALVIVRSIAEEAEKKESAPPPPEA